MPFGFNAKKEKVDLLNFFYPVGSIYETTDADFNPSASWGGTWTKIEGKFLLASGGGYASGSSGGIASYEYTPSGSVASHTLNQNEIPSHNHSIPALSGSAASGGAHYHSYWLPNLQASNAGQGSLGNTSDKTYSKWYTGNEAGTGANEGAHTHSVSTNASNTGSKGGGAGHNHGFNGSKVTMNNMPPYVVINVWKRTA